jgi:glycosyltransferase involved in cell wall biosynthesis
MEEALASSACRECIHFAGRRDDADLARIAAASEGLTYVPLFEGFGLPVLEAFAAGVPVLTSSTTSIPEVAGNAALLVPPDAPDRIAEGMSRLHNDNELRRSLISAGYERLGTFSWDHTAELLWDCLMHVAEQGTSRKQDVQR